MKSIGNTMLPTQSLGTIVTRGIGDVAGEDWMCYILQGGWQLAPGIHRHPVFAWLRRLVWPMETRLPCFHASFVKGTAFSHSVWKRVIHFNQALDSFCHFLEPSSIFKEQDKFLGMRFSWTSSLEITVLQYWSLQCSFWKNSSLFRRGNKAEINDWFVGSLVDDVGKCVVTPSLYKNLGNLSRFIGSGLNLIIIDSSVAVAWIL